MVSAFNGTQVNGTDLVVLLISALVFHMGMTPIAEYLTGQKTISFWSHIGQKIEIRRDEACRLIYALAISVVTVFFGAAMIMTAGSYIYFSIKKSIFPQLYLKNLSYKQYFRLYSSR